MSQDSDAPTTAVALRSEAEQALSRPLPTMDDAEFAGLWRTAKGLAESGLFKDAKQAGQAFAKILAGRDLGLSPFEAMSSLHVLEGKIEASSDLHATRVRQQAGYDFEVFWIKSSTGKAYPPKADGSVDELPPEGEREAVAASAENPTDLRPTVGCAIRFLIDGEPRGVSTWTVEDTLRANLERDRGGKTSPHAAYPRNMYFARAMTNGVAWYVPNVMGGLRVYGVGEIAAGETGEDLTAAPDGPAPAADTTDGLPTAVEAILARAGALGHAGLQNRQAARMAVIGQPDDVVAAWCQRATAELNRMAAGKPEPAAPAAPAPEDEPEDATTVLVTVADFLALKHVAEVLDCWPEAGHVTVIAEPGHTGDVVALIRERTPENLTVHVHDHDPRTDEQKGALSVETVEEPAQDPEPVAAPEEAQEASQAPESTEVAFAAEPLTPEGLDLLRARAAQAADDATAAADAGHPDAERLMEEAERLGSELAAHEDPSQPSFDF